MSGNVAVDDDDVMNLISPYKGRQWGPWVWQAGDTSTHPGWLCYRTPLSKTSKEQYAIDLSLCGSFVEAMDWVLHMSDKDWVGCADVGHLVAALNHVLPLYAWLSNPTKKWRLRRIGGGA